MVNNISNVDESYPYLHEFFYDFNPDMFSATNEPDSIDEMINYYLTEMDGKDNQHLKEVINEFNKIISNNYDENQLREIIVGLGANIRIDTDGWKPTSHTYKEWIVDLKNILQKEYEERIQADSI